MTNYPNNQDNNTTLPGVSGVTDEDTAITALRAATFAIEKELGIVPGGAYVDVRTRLDVLETRVSLGINDGYVHNPVFAGTVIYQGTNLRTLSIPGEITTTSTAPATVVSFVMLDETLCAFDVVVTAAKQTTLTKGGRWKRSVVYRRTGGGITTIVGTLESGTDQETDAGLDVTIDTDGANTVRVRVTGLNATNFNWTAQLHVQETKSAV